MRNLFIISQIILLIILLMVISPFLTRVLHENENSILLGHWEVNIGNGFIKCLPVPWDLPADKGGIGAGDYTGYGIYRSAVIIPSALKEKSLAVFFNGIDDADETFINGKRIGMTGAFPPSKETDSGYISAWAAPRVYYLPESLIKFDNENIIEVKVYNHSGKGGIYGNYHPEINDYKLLEKKAFSLSLIRNSPRLFILSVFAFFIILLTDRVIKYTGKGFLKFFLLHTKESFNPCRLFFVKNKPSEKFYNLLYNISCRYIYILISITAASIFIIYELVMRDATLYGMETLGVKFHIHILYLALLFLILIVNKNFITDDEVYKTKVERACFITAGVLTHPFLFLCYLVFAFTRPSSVLYNDFPKRGSYIIIFFLVLIIIKLVPRIIAFYLQKNETDNENSSLNKTLFKLLLILVSILSIVAYKTDIPLIADYTTVVASFVFIIYIAMILSSDERLVMLQKEQNDKSIKNKTKKSNNEERIETIKNFIIDNCDTELRRDDIAAAMGMSPEYLSRIFNSYTGKTIIDYINEARIEKAAKLLVETDKTVIEIGYSSGFSSLRTFNRSFLKYKGISPSLFRKNR